MLAESWATLNLKSAHPTLYRDLLRQVRSDETHGRQFDVKNRLLSVALSTVEELQDRAQREEREAKPPRLTEADRQLSLAENQLEQCQAATASERQRLKQIEGLRAVIHGCELSHSRIPTVKCLQAEQANILTTLTAEFLASVENPDFDPINSARQSNAIAALARVEGWIRVHKQVAAALDCKVEAAQNALAELEIERAETKVIAAMVGA